MVISAATAALERTAESLAENLYNEIEEIAEQHPLLLMFIEQQEDALNDFLLDEVKKQIHRDQP